MVILSLLSGCQVDQLIRAGTLRDYLDDLNDGFQVFGTQHATSIAVYDDGAWKTYHYGRLDPANSQPPNDSTLYAIGELTELFTTTLMAEWILAGKLSARDSIFYDWPGTVPDFGGAVIRYADLATHTAAFPPAIREDWAKLSAMERATYFAAFRGQDLYDFVANWTPAYPPQLNYEASPVGMAVLAHLLALHSGKDYFDLLQQSLLLPLGMRDTRDLQHLDQQRAARLAPAWSVNGEALPMYQWGAFAGSMSLLSTLSDLQKWMDAHLRPFSSLSDVVALTMEAHYTLGNGLSSGYGWQRVERAGDLFFQRTGLTHQASHIRFSLRKGQAVIILTNTADAATVDFMAEQIWDFLVR